MKAATDLQSTLRALEAIAPLHLAAEWDNVGLLVQIPGQQSVGHTVLTIDCTENVLDQALDLGADFIVAYHPPIFRGLKRLEADCAPHRVLLRAIQAGISIYSPHTALDATKGGVNDWLCSAFEGEVRAIPDPLPPGEAAASGRVVELDDALPLAAVVERIKRHLALDHLRIATPSENPTICSIALCAGAGSSVILGQAADLYWTGEMRHHDVLAALESQRSVVLCDHTNTERGYLTVLRDKLRAALPSLSVTIASEDAEPLRVV